MKLKLAEAFLKAKEEKRAVKKKDLAAKLWPHSNSITQQVNFTNLMNGSTKRITVDMIRIICTELQCSPNDLIDIKS